LTASGQYLVWNPHPTTLDEREMETLWLFLHKASSVQQPPVLKIKLGHLKVKVWQWKTCLEFKYCRL